MDSQHNVKIGSIFLLTRGVAEAKVDKIAGALPPVGVLATPEISLPFISNAVIIADGDFGEAFWAKAIGFTLDENQVPAWQKIGSYIAEGSRKQEEKARFWLLGTPAGLAIVADIEKGAGAPVASKTDWYRGDCVEVFTDVTRTTGKPSKQIFLAYRRPGLDRGTSSAPGAYVGRIRTARGYALEAVIPWSDLGFSEIPSKPFGLDLQVDVGDADGRRLMLSLGTGTNEAWITTQRYLVAHLTPPPSPKP